MIDFRGLELHEVGEALAAFAGHDVTVYVVKESEDRMEALTGRLAECGNDPVEIRFEDRDDRLTIDPAEFTGATLAGEVLTLSLAGGAVILTRR